MLINRRSKWRLLFWSVLVFALAIVMAPQASLAQAPMVWNLKTVDDGGPLGDLGFNGTSITHDANNNMHISYAEFVGGVMQLRYATNASGTFQVFHVDDTGDVGEFSSIAVQANGTVHISYYDFANGNLKYARGTPGAFVITTIDIGEVDPVLGDADVGIDTSMALDSLGNVHISYYDDTNGRLLYATFPSTGPVSVTPTIVDGGLPDDVGLHSSLVVDAANVVHISYYDNVNAELKYRNNVGGAFNLNPPVIVDDGGGVGVAGNDVGSLKTSIALDSNGRVHISYYDATVFQLKYASDVAVPGTFATETIDQDPTAQLGLFTSIAIDSKNGVHISYQDITNGVLKYISKASGGVFGAPAVVDNTAVPPAPQSDTGWYNHITIDSGDHVHISYRDESRGIDFGILRHANSVKNRKADFYGNGSSEVAWRNAGNGALALWLMNGSAISSIGFPLAVTDLSWQIQAFGDFNGDSKADVLWKNAVTGQVAIWIMNGANRVALGFPLTVGDLNWTIQGVGDLNGDGKADVVWRHGVTGQVAVWTMNGTAIAAVNFPLTVDLNWRIQGFGDVNGDDKFDVLWRNIATGQVAIWVMNGPAITNIGFPLTVGDLNWRIEGVGDVNADNKADVIWKHAVTGQVATWRMNGTAIAAISNVRTVGDLNWRIEGIEDLNADNKSDVVWKNAATGQVATWLMNGSTISSIGFPLMVSDLSWQIQN